MIHYQLVCGAGQHGFDGWFRDSAGFDDQVQRGLVSCPQCGDLQVRRALMAPALGRAAEARAPNVPEPRTTEVEASGQKAPDQVQADLVTGGRGKAVARMPDQMRAMLARLRAEVEKSCDYVGSDFAAEARRIHDGKAEARGIYGESTPAQAEALADDGIEVARLPWVDRAEG